MFSNFYDFCIWWVIHGVFVKNVSCGGAALVTLPLDISSSINWEFILFKRILQSNAHFIIPETAKAAPVENCEPEITSRLNRKHLTMKFHTKIILKDL